MRPFIALLTAGAAALTAAIIGSSTGAESITAERIARLPQKQRAEFAAYLRHSTEQEAADRAALAAELKSAGLIEPLIPPGGGAARSTPLNRPDDWYATPEARRIADIIVSFQTPGGGWSKNLNLTDHARRLGEHYAGNNLSRFLGPGDFDTPRDPKWNYVGTLDNDATNTELEFLARVAAAKPEDSAAFRRSFLRGIEYLLAAQFPNGGWPQVYPLEGGYHDAITFNDGAVCETLRLLHRAAEGRSPFDFVPAEARKRAAAAVDRGVECILAAQIIENGRRTVWCQQHDALTLAPVAGRNYEPAALCSAESGALLEFLMELPKPNATIVRAVGDGEAWLEKVAIHDKAYVRGPAGGTLVDRSGAPAIWARYYQIGTDRPIFGDRDKTIHDTVEELSQERRRGYSWYSSSAQAAIDRYKTWRK
ncbi:MAG TPA: pectate lyase [Verrucomicrobiae bacterium]|nr:pectate lyase [Verrucomicrobiae bacterium]